MHITALKIHSNKPLEQLHNSRSETIEHLKDKLKELKNIKFSIHLKIEFTKATNRSSTIANFISKYRFIYNHTEIDSRLDDMDIELMNRIDKWMGEGSGFIIKRIMKHNIKFYKYKAIRGSSYIPLPPKLRNKKGLINIRNDDDECFRWCHLAYLHPVEKNPQRVTKYKQHLDEVNYKNITFPVKLDSIPKIEKMNDIHFNIYIYDYEEGIYPYYISSVTDHNTCELLLIDNGEGKYHYVLIKDFSKLMHSITKHIGKKYFCRSCFSHFNSGNELNDHIEHCIERGKPRKIILPKRGEKEKNIIRESLVHS